MICMQLPTFPTQSGTVLNEFDIRVNIMSHSRKTKPFDPFANDTVHISNTPVLFWSRKSPLHTVD